MSTIKTTVLTVEKTKIINNTKVALTNLGISYESIEFLDKLRYEIVASSGEDLNNIIDYYDNSVSDVTYKVEDNLTVVVKIIEEVEYAENVEFANTNYLKNEELKILMDSVMPDNFKYNQELFYTIFQMFFDYIADAYALGTDSHLLMEVDEKKWDSRISNLYKTDLTEIKSELIKTYMHDVGKFISEMQDNSEIAEYYSSIYNATADDVYNASDLESKIDDMDFLSHKTLSQQKTIPVLFNYIMSFVQKMDIPNIHGVDTFLTMTEGSPNNPKKPFAYTINSSVPKPVYWNAIHPNVHPVGFSPEFKYDVKWYLQDFVNVEIKNNNWKVYTIVEEGNSAFLFNWKEKTVRDPYCSLTIGKNVGTTQFDIDYPNTISDYGLNNVITEGGDGDTLVRVSENEYVIKNEEDYLYDTMLNGGILVEYNEMTGSYTDYEEEIFYENHNLDIHGALILQNGFLYKDDSVIDGWKSENGMVFELFDVDLVTERWEVNNDFEIIDGFVFRITIKELFTSQGIKFSKRDDYLKITDKINIKKVFDLGGSHSIFVTFEDLTEPNYIWTTNDTSTKLLHSFIVAKDKVIIYERGAKILEARYNFATDIKYHIVVQWDEDTGRELWINNEKQFLIDKKVYYPEKMFFRNDIQAISNTDWIIDEVYDFKITYTKYYLYYNTLEEETVEEYFKFKCILKKDGVSPSLNHVFENTYILMESRASEDGLEKLNRRIQDNSDLITAQKAELWKEFARVSENMSEVEATFERNRLNRLISAADEKKAGLGDINVTINDYDIKLADITVSKDELQIQSYFDNVLDTDLNMFDLYVIEGTSDNFLYTPTINQVVVGNSMFHHVQGVARAHYILEDYDIFDRKLTKLEIEGIANGHDEWIIDTMGESGITMYWSLDQAIWEMFHGEMDYKRPMLWNIGGPYDIGMPTLLIKYYIAASGVNDEFDCSIVRKIDHPKALVDWNITNADNAIEWDDVKYVTENVGEGGKTKIIAHFLDGTRLEYIQGEYLNYLYKFYQDVHGNKYNIYTEDIYSKIVYEDGYNHRVYFKRELSFINRDDFDGYATKYIHTLGQFTSKPEFEILYNQARIDITKPLVKIMAKYITQDSALYPTPNYVNYEITDWDSYKYYYDEISYTHGYGIFETEVTLEFIAEWDDPYIQNYTWIETDEEEKWEDQLKIYDLEENYLIDVKEDRYRILNDTSKYILTEEEKENIISFSVWMMTAEQLDIAEITDKARLPAEEKHTINYPDIDTEVSIEETMITEYGEWGFLDYSFDIIIDSFRGDEVDYVDDFQLGEFKLTADEIEEAGAYEPICNWSDDGKIYINQKDDVDAILLPLIGIYDKMIRATDEFTHQYGEEGLGGLLEWLDVRGVISHQYARNLTGDKYHIDVYNDSKYIKADMETMEFTDWTNDVIPISFDTMYFGIPDNPSDELDISRYKIESDVQNRWWYERDSEVDQPDDEYVNYLTREYIDLYDYDKVRKYSPTNLDLKDYYDRANYRTHEVQQKDISYEESPTFHGHPGHIDPAQSALILSQDGGYLENKAQSETNIFNWVDILDPGYWVDSRGFHIYVQPDKEYIYYYDDSYKTDIDFDPATYDFSGTQLYLDVNGAIRKVYKETDTNSANFDDWYYWNPYTGLDEYLTVVDETELLFYWDAKNGNRHFTRVVPKNLLVDADTVHTMEGGSKVWYANITNSNGWFYYEVLSDGTYVETPIEDWREDKIYTMGGQGVEDEYISYRTFPVVGKEEEWFYFTEIYNDDTLENWRVPLTTYEISTIDDNNRARVTVILEDGATYQKIVTVYTPRYYLNGNSVYTDVLQEDFRALFINESSGFEYIKVREYIDHDEEEYVRFKYCVKYEVLGKDIDKAHYIDEDDQSHLLDNDEVDKLVYQDESGDGKWYINIPLTVHKRIYLDDPVAQQYFYYNDAGDYVPIEKYNYEPYSKSFVSTATKYIDIPYRTVHEIWEEERELLYYENANGEIMWVDNSGFAFLSGSTNYTVYETGDGRMYKTYYKGTDFLGRFYVDETNTKIYIPHYDKYIKHGTYTDRSMTQQDKWFRIKYMYNHPDQIYLSQEDVLEYLYNEIIGKGFTETNLRLFYDIV